MPTSSVPVCGAMVRKFRKRRMDTFNHTGIALFMIFGIIFSSILIISPSVQLSSSKQLVRQGLFSDASTALSVSSYRNPSGNPVSYEPVLVFAQLSGKASEADLQLFVRATVACSSNNTGVLNCPPFSSLSVPYQLRFLPYLAVNGWYFSIIPGLPAKSQIIPGLCGLRRCHTNITISSSASYSVYLNGRSLNSSSYQVVQGSYASLPPIVGSFVSSNLTDPSTRNETYGLSPEGWVAGPNEQIQLISFAFSPGSINSLDTYYSVSNSSWKSLPESTDALQSNVTGAISALNAAIGYVNSITSRLGFSFSTVSNPILVQDASIPAVPLGNYVTFKANSTSKDQKTTTSPEGFYYVVNKSAQTRVLVIDPHVELWLFLQNLGIFANTVHVESGYGMPASLIASDNLRLTAAQLWSSFQEEQFHYWNVFGENYNISISFPDSNIANLLQPASNGGFQPNVIYLSDISLGYGQSGSTAAKQFFDWDLNDSQDSNGNTILSDIINYVEHYQPTGLIASAGTLSDWEVWQSCNQARTKIGSRGNIGETLSDANPVNETTIAAMLGMPLLSVFEYARNSIATFLCSSPQTAPAGEAVGSTPLLVPMVPWNGLLAKPNSQLILNVNPSITVGLSPTFSLSFPSVYQNYGYNATNTIGWQLSLPSVLASAAWQAANESRNQAVQFEQNLAAISSNVTGRGVTANALDYSLNRGLHDVFNSISGASINSSFITVKMYIPYLQSYKEFSIPIGDISKLASLLPVQVAALSPNYAAGIVTYDKYYTSTGYRSVYLSFPIESSNQLVASTLFSNAITWSQQWKYKSMVSILGGLPVSSSTMHTFQQASANAHQITNASLLLNEQGNTTISFNSPSQNSRLSVIVVHPSSENVSLEVANGKVLSYSSLGNNVSEYQIESSSQSKVNIYLTSDAEASLTPVYVEVVGTSTSISSSSTSTSSTSAASSYSSSQSTQTISSRTTTFATSFFLSIQTRSSSSPATESSQTQSSPNTFGVYLIYTVAAVAVAVVALGSALALRKQRGPVSR